MAHSRHAVARRGLDLAVVPASAAGQYPEVGPPPESPGHPVVAAIRLPGARSRSVLPGGGVQGCFPDVPSAHDAEPFAPSPTRSHARPCTVRTRAGRR